MANEVLIVFAIIILGMGSELIIYASRYKKVPPDKAMVVYGRAQHPGSHVGYMIISGGGKFLVPVIEAMDFLNLGVRRLELEIPDAFTQVEGEMRGISARASALVRVSSERSMLKTAAENLLSKDGNEIDLIARTVIEGAIRSTLRHSTYEDIDRNWETTAMRAWNLCESDLNNIGLEIRAMVFQDISLEA